ncbi:hypothetical protein [Streptomyces orinoci]|uniref:hypothetical protein n=1 Tax=Streptomyces orinoci TaxID=67339 RepID=UPI00240E87A2|nr:hypothetical protein [Streptomyces orinoci]
MSTNSPDGRSGGEPRRTGGPRGPRRDDARGGSRRDDRPSSVAMMTGVGTAGMTVVAVRVVGFGRRDDDPWWVPA